MFAFFKKRVHYSNSILAEVLKQMARNLGKNGTWYMRRVYW